MVMGTLKYGLRTFPSEHRTKSVVYPPCTSKWRFERFWRFCRFVESASYVLSVPIQGSNPAVSATRLVYRLLRLFSSPSCKNGFPGALFAFLIRHFLGASLAAFSAESYRVWVFHGSIIIRSGRNVNQNRLVLVSY